MNWIYWNLEEMLSALQTYGNVGQLIRYLQWYLYFFRVLTLLFVQRASVQLIRNRDARYMLLLRLCGYQVALELTAIEKFDRWRMKIVSMSSSKSRRVCVFNTSTGSKSARMKSTAGKHEKKISQLFSRDENILWSTCTCDTLILYYESLKLPLEATITVKVPRELWECLSLPTKSL